MEETTAWQFEKLEARKKRNVHRCLVLRFAQFLSFHRMWLSQFWLNIFSPLQVVDSKATVKRTTKPRRSSRTLNVENENELASQLNGRATSGHKGSCGEQESRGLVCTLLFYYLVTFFTSKEFFLSGYDSHPVFWGLAQWCVLLRSEK